MFLMVSVAATMMVSDVVGASAAPVTRAYEGPTSVPAEEESPVVGEALRPKTTMEREADFFSDPHVVRPAAEPFTAVRVRPVLDLAIVAGAAAPSLALGVWVQRSLPLNVPMPGAEADVGRFDRVALGRFENGPRIASDVLLAVGLAAPLVYHGVEAGLRRRGWASVRGRGFFVRYGSFLVLYGQALAINALVTEVLKASIGRPRPYALLDPEDVDPDRREQLLRAQERFDADWSFPSGHTSAAFTASTAGATLLTLELLGRSRWGIAVAWVGGTAVAATTAAMRVLAGRHYPSDVVTSALLGSAVGAAVPLAHWRPPRPGDRSARRWTVGPMSGRNVGGLQIRGSLP